MSAHRLPADLFKADFKVVDPGDGETILLGEKGIATIKLKTAAAETRTLHAPEKVGQLVLVYLDTDGGDCVVSVPQGAVTTTFTLDDAGDWFLLMGETIDDTLKWLVVSQSGVSISGQNFGTDVLKVNSIPVSPYKLVTINCLLNSHCIDQAFFTADRAYQVTGVTEIHATAGNDAGSVNVQLVKDTGTDAPGAGTDLLTNNAGAGFNLKGTANTMQTGTLTGTTASLQLAAGDRLSLDFAGTVTTLAGVQVTVQLKPI